MNLQMQRTEYGCAKRHANGHSKIANMLIREPKSDMDRGNTVIMKSNANDYRKANSQVE